jgi:hypothetical protein
MAAAQSSSHHVYVSSDVVVKFIDAAGHSRLDRETALAPHLPAGLTAPFLGSGLGRLGTRDVRYACYARVPGAAPGIGMPGVDGVTARLLAAGAVQRLGGLHSWVPAGRARQTLEEPLDHGGFVSQAALYAGIENLAALNRDAIVPGPLLGGLTAGGGARAVARTGRRPGPRGLSLGQLARARPQRDGAAGLRMGSLRRTGR